MIKKKVQNIKSSHQANLENQGSDNMKQGWEIMKLGEVSEILNGGTPKTNIAEYWDGEIYWITPADLGKLKKPTVDDTPRKITRLGLEKSSAKLFPENSIILSTRAPIGHLAINEVPMSTNQGCRGIVPSKKLDTWFLYYFLKKNVELLDSLGTGATFKELSTKALAGVEIPLPPLPEQQRIVSILDEAFAAIAKAKANAEQNLKNAKELFESYLQKLFEKKGDGWEEQLLEDCFKMKSGDNLTAKNMSEGEYPVFGGNGIAGYHNQYNLSGSNVIIGRVGALCGNVRHITENIWLTDNAFKVVDFKFDFDHSFLTYLLNHKDLRSYARQAAQPVISNSSLKDVVLNFPKSKKEQQTIVLQLDALRAETQKLEAVYQKKIADLEELKKSILQKAFAGELTESKIKEPCV
jgi:type I restriction enzyme S subunit